MMMAIVIDDFQYSRSFPNLFGFLTAGILGMRRSWGGSVGERRDVGLKHFRHVWQASHD
jgi:hypothetical protein